MTRKRVVRRTAKKVFMVRVPLLVERGGIALDPTRRLLSLGLVLQGRQKDVPDVLVPLVQLLGDRALLPSQGVQVSDLPGHRGDRCQVGIDVVGGVGRGGLGVGLGCHGRFLLVVLMVNSI
jgi:hypothetical protein